MRTIIWMSIFLMAHGVAHILGFPNLLSRLAGGQYGNLFGLIFLSGLLYFILWDSIRKEPFTALFKEDK